MSELEAIKTPVTTQQMAMAFYVAYHKFFGRHPTPESVKILLSQWALETGWGKSMWCFNVGNAKSAGYEGDWCFYACNEILTKKSAEIQVAREPSFDKLAKITTRRADGSCIVWFYPKHPWSRFRAFRTLEDGAYDHLKMVVYKFDKAWPFVVQGDPVEYSKALKKQGYYTADEAHYTRVLKSVYEKFDKITLPGAPLFSEKEREEILNALSVSLQGMVIEHPDGLQLEED